METNVRNHLLEAAADIRKFLTAASDKLGIVDYKDSSDVGLAISSIDYQLTGLERALARIDACLKEVK